VGGGNLRENGEKGEGRREKGEAIMAEGRRGRERGAEREETNSEHLRFDLRLNIRLTA
jgi:hypothetical protein